LRALAVMAVIVFHTDPDWLPGGFLGVDVFFVISGYLICSLVLAEHRRSATVSLVAFWGRRARRLLPALYAVLLGACVSAVLFARDTEDGLFGDVLAALTYVSNWWLIADDDSYFDVFGRPPLLRHLWSLAVEEQFYVLFPIMMAALFRYRRVRPPIASVTLAAAGASTLLMAILYDPNGDPSRVYYGTDTRAAGLFVGVALASVWPAGELRQDLTRRQTTVVDGLAWSALGVLFLAMVLLDEQSALLYRGGFLLVSVLAAIALAMAVHPAARIGRILSWPPLLWVGTRSYALYLWHWPVLVLTRPATGDPEGGMPAVLQWSIVAVLAEVSWRFVEQPFRTGRVARWWDVQRPGRRRNLLLGLAGVLAVLGTVLWLGRNAEVPTLLEDGETSVTPTLPPLTTTPAPTPPTTAPRGQTPGSTTTTTTPAPLGPMLAIGDSVMLGARDALTFASGGAIAVDAAVSRQVDDGLDILQGYRDRGDLDRFQGVVIHLGTNGPFTPDQVPRLLDLVGGVDRVVVVNARVAQPWQDETNATVASLADEPNIEVADWYGASGAGGVIEGDGVHPTPSGAALYARVIVEAARRLD